MTPTFDPKPPSSDLAREIQDEIDAARELAEQIDEALEELRDGKDN